MSLLTLIICVIMLYLILEALLWRHKYKETLKTYPILNKELTTCQSNLQIVEEELADYQVTNDP